MANDYGTIVKVEGRKKDMDALYEILRPAEELCEDDGKKDYWDILDDWTKVLDKIFKDLGCDNLSSLMMSGIEYLNGTISIGNIWSTHAPSNLPQAIVKKFPNLHVYHFSCFGADEGRCTNDIDEKYFRWGWQIDANCDLCLNPNDEEAQKLQPQTLAETEPCRGIVCHEKSELLQKIAEVTGKNLTEDEWNKRGLFFSETKLCIGQ